MVSSTRGLADEHLLEAALERRVLLDPLAVLVEGGRADHPQLTAGQHRLEHVARVHRGVAARAGADDGVQLVDEGDDLTLGVLDLLEHGLEPLLELAAVLRAGDHRGEVEREQPPALERVGHVAVDDALRQALDDGGLADAGSPISTGLFLVRRDSTWTTRRISASRPMTGSSLPSRARAVRSTAYFSSAWYVDSGSWLVTRRDAAHAGQRAAQRVGAGAGLRSARSRPGCRPSRAAISRCSVET